MTFKNEKGQLADWVKFLSYLIFSAGVLYGTMKAALSDIEEIKTDIQAKAHTGEVIHKDHEVRIRGIEIDKRGMEEELKAIRQSLDRIERKIDRGR